MAGFIGNLMINFEDLLTIFQIHCIILYFHQQSAPIRISPHPCQYLLLPSFLVLCSKLGVKWHLIVVLICTLQMADDVESLLIIWITSLEKYLF